MVDNASTDCSAAMLTGLADAGLCELVLNRENRYHWATERDDPSYVLDRC